MCKTNGIYAVHTIIHSNIHIYAKGAETARLRLMTDAAYRFYEHSHIIYAHHAPHTCDYQITGDRRASECVVKKKKEEITVLLQVNKFLNRKDRKVEP